MTCCWSVLPQQQLLRWSRRVRLLTLVLAALLLLCSAWGAAVSGETLKVFTELLSKTEFHPLIAHNYCF